jgi:hypothetical protein
MVLLELKIKTLRIHPGVLLAGDRETHLPIHEKLAKALGVDIKELLD